MMYSYKPSWYRSFRKFSSVSKFDFRDPLKLQKLLTREEKQIQQVARDFTNKNLKPKVLDAFRSNIYDPKIHQKVGEAGLFGGPFTGYGVSSISNVEFGLI